MCMGHGMNLLTITIKPTLERMVRLWNWTKKVRFYYHHHFSISIFYIGESSYCFIFYCVDSQATLMKGINQIHELYYNWVAVVIAARIVTVIVYNITFRKQKARRPSSFHSQSSYPCILFSLFPALFNSIHHTVVALG